MAQIITQILDIVNKIRHLSDNPLSHSPNHNILYAHNTVDHNRSLIEHKIEHRFLNMEEFKLSNQHKRAWIKAAIKECKLRLNEIHVLEALTFLTDPIYGKGSPSIGCIREKLIEYQNLDLKYNTIRQALERLKKKGAISYTGSPNKPNTYLLIGFESKLETGSSDSVYDLNQDLNLRDRSNNHYHYNEYESLFNNSENSGEIRKNLEESGKSFNKNVKVSNLMELGNYPEIPNSSFKNSELIPLVKKNLTEQTESVTEQTEIGYQIPILKSEWQVARETLSQELYGEIESKIPEGHRKEAILTLKRLNATDEQKSTLISEVGKIAKLTQIRNIGGMLVSVYRKIREHKMDSTHRNRNFAEEHRKKMDAEEMAKRRLKDFGITDPRLRPGATYEEMRAYDDRLSSMTTACLKDFYKTPTVEERQPAKRTWAEIAYQ